MMSTVAKTSKKDDPLCWICLSNIYGEEDNIDEYKSDDSKDEDNSKKDLNEIPKFCKCTGSMSYVHQECLNKWLTSKHKHVINDKSSYPWNKLPEIKCKICTAKYSYSLKRNLAIRKRDFSLIFLVLAQSIIFIMDLFYNTDNSSFQSCELNSQCLNFPDEQRYNYNEYCGNFFSQFYHKFNQPNKELLVKEIIYKGANLLAFVTVVVLICAGIYNLYQGFNKSLIVHPIKQQKKRR